MNQRNLLPARRLAAKRKERAVRRWVTINAVAALGVAGVGVACYFASPVASAVGPTPVVAVDVEKLNASFVRLRQESLRAKADLLSVQDLSEGPDWSVLLAVLAHALGDDVVFDSVDAVVDPTATPGPADTGRRQVRLGGVARSQAAVTQFILRLEALHFFRQVQLTQTTPQSLHDAACVGFRLVCTLPEAGGN